MQELARGMPVFVTIWVFVAGTVVGSFLNVVIARVPKRRSIVSPGGRCPRGGNPIAWYDNIPLLSWILLRGRCRSCGLAISARYPLVELLMGILAVAVLRHTGPTWTPLGYFVLLAALVAPSYLDLDGVLLPHQITWPLLAAALLAPTWSRRIPCAAAGSRDRRTRQAPPAALRHRLCRGARGDGAAHDRAPPPGARRDLRPRDRRCARAAHRRAPAMLPRKLSRCSRSEEVRPPVPGPQRAGWRATGALRRRSRRGDPARAGSAPCARTARDALPPPARDAGAVRGDPGRRRGLAPRTRHRPQAGADRRRAGSRRGGAAGTGSAARGRRRGGPGRSRGEPARPTSAGRARPHALPDRGARGRQPEAARSPRGPGTQ